MQNPQKSGACPTRKNVHSIFKKNVGSSDLKNMIV
jgi:hypothetical protein